MCVDSNGYGGFGVAGMGMVDVISSLVLVYTLSLTVLFLLIYVYLFQYQVD